MICSQPQMLSKTWRGSDSYSKSRKLSKFLSVSRKNGTFMKKKNRHFSGLSNRYGDDDFQNLEYDVPYSVNKKKRWDLVDGLQYDPSKYRSWWWNESRKYRRKPYWRRTKYDRKPSYRKCLKPGEKSEDDVHQDKYYVMKLEGDTIRGEKRAMKVNERKIRDFKEANDYVCPYVNYVKKERKGKKLKSHYRCDKRFHNKCTNEWVNLLDEYKKIKRCEDILLVSCYGDYLKENHYSKKMAKKSSRRTKRRKARKKKNREMKRDIWDYVSSK